MKFDIAIGWFSSEMKELKLLKLGVGLFQANYQNIVKSAQFEQNWVPIENVYRWVGNPAKNVYHVKFLKSGRANPRIILVEVPPPPRFWLSTNEHGIAKFEPNASKNGRSGISSVYFNGNSHLEFS